MQLPMTVGNYGRPRVGLPTTRLVNAYIEASQEGPTQAARIPRPGLTLQYVVGSGPILRQFQQPGAFSGDLFSISGAEIYRGQTKIGDTPLSPAPRMASANGVLAVTAGGNLYVYDGATFTQIHFFSDGITALPFFTSVVVLYDIFVFPVLNSTQFFWSSVGDPTTINAADFGNAQTDPSPIVEVAVLAEELMFFKSTAVEFWDYQGALAAPFALSQGRTYIRGCAAQSGVVKLDNAMFWVADDLSVYRSGAVPQQISTPFINDRTQQAAADSNAFIAFTMSVEGHVFYVLDLPTIDVTYAYDCQTQEWAQWGTTYTPGTDPGALIVQVSAGHAMQTIYAGSANDGSVYAFDPSSNFDGTFPKEVVVDAARWISGGVERCNNIALQCVRGVGNSDAADPVVRMRYSDDGGRSFGAWLTGHLGAAGAYSYKAAWRNLGLIQQPGRLIEFSVTDPVPFVAEGCTMNEARV